MAFQLQILSLFNSIEKISINKFCFTVDNRCVQTVIKFEIKALKIINIYFIRIGQYKIFKHLEFKLDVLLFKASVRIKTN